MTAVYDKHGIRFRYPENWSLDDDRGEDWPQSVSLESPHSSFWTLFIYHVPIATEVVMGEFVEAMRADYPDIEVHDDDGKIGDVPYVGYEFHFENQEVYVSARVRAVQLGMYVLVVLYQAESREFDQTEPVFEAITATLVLGDKAAAALGHSAALPASNGGAAAPPRNQGHKRPARGSRPAGGKRKKKSP